MRKTIVILIAAALMQSCAASRPKVASTEDDTVGRSTALPHRTSIAAAPEGEASEAVCPTKGGVPGDWIPVVDETGEYELRMPPSLRPVPKGKFVFIHGGEAWEDEQTTVSISFGHWAEYSFDDMPGKRCRISLGDESVFMIVGTDSILAWYDRQSGSHEPVVSVSTNSNAARATAAALALSLTRRNGS